MQQDIYTHFTESLMLPFLKFLDTFHIWIGQGWDYNCWAGKGTEASIFNSENILLILLLGEGLHGLFWYIM